MHTRYLDSIKTFEGFTREASWDYAQYSNGFGTKALYPGEQITPAEADRRFKAEIEQARQFVEKHAAGWDDGTKAALTSLTFNAGTRWASSGLGEAVRGFDIERLKARFLEYTKAGGKDLPGLVQRRLSEAAWIGAGGDFAGVPTVTGANPVTQASKETVVASIPVIAVPQTSTDVEFVVPRSSNAGADQASLSTASAILLMLLEHELSRAKAADGR